MVENTGDVKKIQITMNASANVQRGADSEVPHHQRWRVALMTANDREVRFAWREVREAKGQVDEKEAAFKAVMDEVSEAEHVDHEKLRKAGAIAGDVKHELLKYGKAVETAVEKGRDKGVHGMAKQLVYFVLTFVQIVICAKFADFNWIGNRPDSVKH